MKTSEKKEVKEKAKKEDSQKVKNIKFHTFVYKKFVFY